MRRTIAILLFLCQPSWGSYAFVSCTGTCTCTTTVATSCNATPSTTVGQLLTANIRMTSGDTISIPTSSNETWSCNTTFDPGGSALRMCWAIAGVTGTDTVTFSVNVVGNLQVAVQQYSGVPVGCVATNITDGVQVTGNTASGTSCTTSSSLVTTDTDLLFAAAASGDTSWTAGNIFGSASTLRNNAARSAGEDRLNIASGSGTGAITIGATSDCEIILEGFHGVSCPSASVKNNSVLMKGNTMISGKVVIQ